MQDIPFDAVFVGTEKVTCSIKALHPPAQLIYSRDINI